MEKLYVFVWILFAVFSIRGKDSVKRLLPGDFKQLPTSVVKNLERRGCRIPQSYGVKKKHNVISGNFFRRGQKDWAVLCSRKGVSSILIFPNGLTKNVSEIAKSINAENNDELDKSKVLEKAGIERASALITTLPVDADNLFIVLTARALNPKLTIISRASDDNSDKKLKTAGADNVIMPDKIGGAHMASLVLKPDVIEFIDHITGQGGPDINLEEITFDNLPQHLRNKTIRDLEIRNKSGANIVGFKKGNGEYVINPDPDTQLIPDGKLFVLGTQEQIVRLKELLS